MDPSVNKFDFGPGHVRWIADSALRRAAESDGGIGEVAYYHAGRRMEIDGHAKYVGASGMWLRYEITPAGRRYVEGLPKPKEVPDTAMSRALLSMIFAPGPRY